MKNNREQNKFALIGAAGYIAPRHMKAIKETNNLLCAAVDKNDSVGIIDQYFPNASFFTTFERFDRYVEKENRSENPLDFLSICSPNHLHDAHIRYGLRNNTNVICEKPIVLNPWNLEGLEVLEKESGKKLYNILQLRLHESMIALKEKVDNAPNDQKFDVDLTYLTSRGNWYYASWKGEDAKSGGIATNIGIHFFDILGWIFGEIQENVVHLHDHDRASGYLEFEKARVRWFLSINYDTLPKEVTSKGKRTFRSIKMDGEEIEFSDGFENLHTKSYTNILRGEGFGIEECKSAINIVHDIRNAVPVGLKGEFHPLAKLKRKVHPFKS